MSENPLVLPRDFFMRESMFHLVASSKPHIFNLTPNMQHKASAFKQGLYEKQSKNEGAVVAHI